MLLTISTTHHPATDLGYLLHKNPGRFQSFPLPFGRADVFYPEADADRCTAVLLLDIDPVGLVRPKAGASSSSGWLQQYVNDRPYVASSHLTWRLLRCSTARWSAAPGTGLSWRNNRSHWKPSSPPCRPGRDRN